MPKLTRVCFINFYGGEPLLSYDLIKRTVSSLNEKNKKFVRVINYSITTNGSLITEEIIRFFNDNKFSVMLSFDGLVQDISREKNTSEEIVLIIDRLLDCPSINLEINSVFTPKTINYLSESMKFIIELGVSNVNFSLSLLDLWDRMALKKLENELRKLNDFLLGNYKRKDAVPVVNFRRGQEKGIFYCAAGKDRMAITPEGKIWGCFLFYDYFKRKKDAREYDKYCFGNLDNFIEHYKTIYPLISSNYAQLSMENFSTRDRDCHLCPELEGCSVCPVIASFALGPLGQIPGYICDIQKIKMKEIKKFEEK